MSNEYINSESCGVQSIYIGISKDGYNFVEIRQIDIMNFCAHFSMFTPIVTFTAHFNDSQNVFSHLNTDAAAYMKVRIIDKYAMQTGLVKSVFNRIFRISKIDKVQGARTQLIRCSGQDNFTYTLGTTYLKRNQVITLHEYFESILELLNAKKILNDSKIELDVVGSDEDEEYSKIRITSDRSVLENFAKLGAEKNMHFFQSQHKLHYRPWDIQNISVCTDYRGSAMLFSDDVPRSKGHNVGKIHEYTPIAQDMTESDPFTHSHIQVGTDDYQKSNTMTSVISDLLINNNTNYLKAQNSQGTRSDPDMFDPPGKQKYTLTRQYIQKHMMNIFVPGCFAYDDIYKMISVKIGANAVNSDTLKGNTALSGKWIVGRADYMFNDGAFNSRLGLMRFDNPEELM